MRLLTRVATSAAIDRHDQASDGALQPEDVAVALQGSPMIPVGTNIFWDEVCKCPAVWGLRVLAVGLWQ
jgi:hypothetical protein